MTKQGEEQVMPCTEKTAMKQVDRKKPDAKEKWEMGKLLQETGLRILSEQGREKENLASLLEGGK